MESSNAYNFNLFRPGTKYGRKNRNMIMTLLLIWAVTVFGFQILLRVLQRPTPEPTLAVFTGAWYGYEQGTPYDGGELLRSLVLVTGKNAVKPDDRKVLQSAISWFFYGMAGDSLSGQVQAGVAAIGELQAGLLKAGTGDYLAIKQQIAGQQASLAGLTTGVSGFVPGGLESTILIHSLLPEAASPPDPVILPGIMRHYLVHNQSVLTDTRFLGFPFHYFYTAVFLLVLFVGLCLAYNLLLQRRQRLEHIEE